MRMRELLHHRKAVEKKIEEIETVVFEQLEGELEEVNKMIRAQCKHPAKFVETKRLTIEGGYLNKTEYHRWRECSQCGAKSEVEVTYGGYG